MASLVSSSQLDKHYSFFEALYHDQACHLHAVADDGDRILRRLYVGSKEAASDKRWEGWFQFGHVLNLMCFLEIFLCVFMGILWFHTFFCFLCVFFLSMGFFVFLVVSCVFVVLYFFLFLFVFLWFSVFFVCTPLCFFPCVVLCFSR